MTFVVMCNRFVSQACETISIGCTKAYMLKRVMLHVRRVWPQHML
jgi:hypothetical protein